MEAGIVGLPNVGKSTLFNALTSAGIASENYPFCTIEPNVGVVPVPDPRLQIISNHIKTKVILPAILRLVDIAGIVKGASEGEGLGNKFLSHIRDVDAILHVVRCFENDDVIHVDGKVDPIRDIETIDLELILADLQSIETSLAKAKRMAKLGDAEAKVLVDVLIRCSECLESEKPIRSLEFEDAEHLKMIKGYSFLTAKPILYVTNVAEDDLEGKHELVQRVRQHAAEQNGEVVPVCASLEAELSELEEDDQREMLEAVGLEEPALALLARGAYKTLGLQSYFTAGEKEVRAWTIPIGATAPEAAGVIHTDFERAFIRCETYSVADLEELHSERAIREAGRLRVEGKTYIVQDGDICHFLANP